jgi:3-oxoadipate enol-lactonase
MNKANINGFEMAFVDEGNGDTLLFIHGFPFTHALWKGQIEEFQNEYRVLAPDLRGFGESGGVEEDERRGSMDEYADDLAALLQSLNIRQATLVGLSMGGYVAFAFRRKYPQMVKALVLADSRAEADTEEGKQNRYKLIDNVKAKGAQAVIDSMMPKLFAPESYDIMPDVVAELKEIIESNSAAGIVNAAYALADRADSTPDLAEINLPVLVLVGEQDQITPLDMSRTIATYVPGAILEIVPDAGHVSNLENPVFFNDRLRAFLHGDTN